jgi:hypothetical protein
MPDDKIRERLDEFLSRPKRGEPGYECPNHPPSHRCLSCITEDELLDAGEEWSAADA